MSITNFGLLSLLSILWGGSFYFVEKSLFYFSFEQVVFYRVFFAAIAIFIFLIIKKVKWNFSLKLWLIFLLMGVLNNVIPFLSFTYAQEYITASSASIFNATTPIFTVLFAHLLTKDERLSKNKIIGIFIGFIGIVVLVFPKASLSIELPILFALIGPISYAFAGIFGKILKGTDPLYSVFGMLTCSSIIMYVIFHDSITFSHINSFGEVSNLLMLAVFSTTIAYIIYFRLLFVIGAVKLLLVTFLIPISASFLGIFLLDEVFTTNMYIGSFFVFFALILILKDKK